MNEKLRNAIYIRVSTENPDRERYGLGAGMRRDKELGE
jgi:hypothetical protein